MAYTDIDKPSDYFNTVLYTGNATGRTITGVGFQPDWVWGKVRSEAQDHVLVDSIRGATKQLYSSDTAAEQTEAQGLTGFDSDGFTLGTHAYFNGNSKTYVAWNWKKTATAGFDIVSFTGNGSARTISHSLSAVPKMYIVKNRSTGSTQWRVYHASLGATKHMALDATQAVGTASSVFNNTEPTSSVFSVGTDDAANKNGDSLIAYLFAEKQGYSKFGSYTGNGNADGTFVYTGFKPAWVMWKKTNAASEWIMVDSKRNTSNEVDKLLRANQSSAENTYGACDFLSNGWKFRDGDTDFQASGDTYIYMAFAENPFVTSTGVPATAR